MACREEELYDRGSYLEFSVGDQSVVVVKDADGSIRGFFNACRHRGTQLVCGSGRLGEFRCPFHGWRYHLDGSIKLVIDESHFEPRPVTDLGLIPLQVSTWGGWVFINMDPGTEPLMSYLDPIPTLLEPFHLENMRYRWFKRIELGCNWKTAIDGFIEAYHTPGTHPQLLRANHDNCNPLSLKELQGLAGRFDSTIETFGMHSRFVIGARGSEGRANFRRYDGSTDASLDPRESVANYVQYMATAQGTYSERDVRAAAELRTAAVPSGYTASSYYMELRKKYAIADGLDWVDISSEQLRAAGSDWHIFPNMIILPNQGFAFGYRALPNGLDPDSCIFDAFCIEQVPVADYGVRRSFSPEVFADWRHANFGKVFEQDFALMASMTAGMHSRSFDGHHLNFKQEASILHHHKIADGFLWRMQPEQ
jgi:phenylpropionate dioxygenase-like ring-hydroxylating dioxygenase large terminal subunit